MPSLEGNIIHCEYTLLIRLKFSHHMPKEERPTFIMTVYIVHKLDDDHIEKKKKEADRIKEEQLINEFEIIEIDNKDKKMKQII